MDGAAAAMRRGSLPGEDADLSDLILSSEFKDVPLCGRSIYSIYCSVEQLLESSWKKKKNNPQDDISVDEVQLQISPHIDSFSSLLFTLFLVFCVAGAHYMLWFTLVQLCFHGSCSTNHRVWLFAQRPNSFTPARNSAPFHSSAL